MASSHDQSFEHIFRAHYEHLVHFAMRYVGDQETAEDVVGTVFLNLWESRDSWSPEKGAAPFLYGSVRNRALNVVRDRAAAHERARRYDAADISGVFAQEQNTASSIYNSENIQALKAAITELSEEQRTIMHLRWKRQLSWKDIATVLGQSVDAVSKRHERTLDALRTTLRTRLPGLK